MHVATLLRSNKTAQKLAPESILAKFAITHDSSATDVDVPRQLNSLSEVRELLQRIVNSGNVPAQFLRVLEASANGNEQLEHELTAANALIHWSSTRRTFESPWNMDIVKQALTNISQYENKPTSKPPTRPLLKNREKSHRTEAATEALSEPGTRNNGQEFQDFPKSGAFAQITTASLLGGQTFNVTQRKYYRITKA